MERKKKILGSAMVSALAVGVIVALMLFTSVEETIFEQILDEQVVEEIIKEKKWHTIPLGELLEMGSTEGGFLACFIYAHQAVPATAYAVNLSNTSGQCMAYGDYSNSSGMTGYVNHSTAFDIVIKVKANTSMAQNTTTAWWNISRLACYITAGNISVGPNAAMTCVNITAAHTPVYNWYNFYLNNGGAGYTITAGQQVNISLFYFQAYY